MFIVLLNNKFVFDNENFVDFEINFLFYKGIIIKCDFFFIVVNFLLVV